MMSKSRGRPPKAYLIDPDRHVMALAVMFQTQGCSRRGAVEIAVCSMEGLPTRPSQKPGWGRGINLLDVEFELKRRPGAAATVAGRARTIRQKMKKWVRADREGATRWLTTMAQAWAVAIDLSLPGRPPADELERLATIAETAGEAEFCRNVLVPLANRRGVEI